MNETFLNIRGSDDVVGGGQALLGVAVRRSHGLLPREAGLRSGRDGTSQWSSSVRSSRLGPG